MLTTNRAMKLYLEVIGGVDHGARVDLDAPTCTIGRADDCDLILHDRAISRRHAIVTRTETGVHLETCPGKAPVIVKEEAVHYVELKPGVKLLIGDTTIAVRSSDDRHVSVSTNNYGGTTERRGIGVSALHQIALDALIKALTDVTDVAELVSRTQAWCVEYFMGTDVQLHASTDRATIAPVSEDDEVVRIAVPMPGHSATLVFTCLPPTGDALRKTLVMAGQLFAFALNRTRRPPIVDERGVPRRTPSDGARVFFGSSPAARRLLHLISKLSASDSNVLLTGETGSGKSFVARLIHEQGPRAKEPFEDINCATIPETLFESELFGHERGAFTSAVKSSIGRFEAAGRGTVFLDEIGELSPSSQAKLLRVLAERRFERIGSNRPIRFEARVISATNHDLEAMIAAGEFRRDLFYRIAVIRETVPPLRDRGEDIVQLAEHLLRSLSAVSRRHVEGFSEGAIRLILSYSWPGNVRELSNAIERALALGDGPKIEAFELTHVIAAILDQASPPASGPAKSPTRRTSVDHHLVNAALARTGGNLSKAAALLGVSRQTIYNRRGSARSERPPTVPKKNGRP